MNHRERLYERYGTFFQSAPEVFNEKAASRWGRAYDYYFRHWLPDRKPTTIVDLACGYGRLLHYFKERKYENVQGVDISPDQVRRARQVIPAVHEANVLDFLEDNKECYDLITALDLIEHLTKEEVFRFLDGCRNALRPGGRLIIQTPNADSPFGMASRYNDFTHEVCFNPNSLTRIMAICGFDRIDVREMTPVPWGYSFASTLRWVGWRAIRVFLHFWNLAETGVVCRVLTRNMLVSGCKPKKVE